MPEKQESNDDSPVSDDMALPVFEHLTKVEVSLLSRYIHEEVKSLINKQLWFVAKVFGVTNAAFIIASAWYIFFEMPTNVAQDSVTKATDKVMEQSDRQMSSAKDLLNAIVKETSKEFTALAQTAATLNNDARTGQKDLEQTQKGLTGLREQFRQAQLQATDAIEAVKLEALASQNDLELTKKSLSNLSDQLKQAQLQARDAIEVVKNSDLSLAKKVLDMLSTIDKNGVAEELMSLRGKVKRLDDLVSGESRVDSLNVGRLTVTDSAGNARVRLEIDDKGPAIQLTANNGSVRCLLRLDGDNPELYMLDGHEVERIRLDIDKGWPSLILKDEAGHTQVFLYSEKTTGLSLGPRGGREAKISIQDDLSQVLLGEIRGKTEVTRASLWVDNKGIPHVSPVPATQ